MPNLSRIFILILTCSLLVTSGGKAHGNPREAKPADSASVRPAGLVISEAEFRSLAIELARKVNLFRDVWAIDPNAEFFGGTSRDYLYWLKGHLAKAKSQGELRNVVAELRAMDIIDVREFILFESDVDVVMNQAREIKADTYGVKKIDSIKPDRFDPRTPEGQNELHQGYIPAEKIRLGHDGFGDSSIFGDGVAEIFRSKLSVHFATDAEFASTHYAKQGLNHPVLLALRFVRLLAMDYYKTYGSGYPRKEDLLSGADRASAERVADVIVRATSDSRISDLLKNTRFKNWMNQAIQKAFRSYTNTTATRMLFTHFKADALVSNFEGLEPINQYLFVVRRDERLIEKNWRESGFEAREVLEPALRHFPDGKLYHGTRSEAGFRSILFQGTLPSEGGSAGAGLYGVDKGHVQFAVDWGGDERRVVQIEIAPNAKIIDIKQGPGKELFERFSSSYQGTDVYSAFAEAYGADLLRYPYSTNAFVVKNGAVLKSVDGYKRKLMKFGAAIEFIRTTRALALRDVLTIVQDNLFSAFERETLFKEPRVVEATATARGLPLDRILPRTGDREAAPMIEFVAELLPENFERAYDSFELRDFIYDTDASKFMNSVKVTSDSKARGLLVKSYFARLKTVLAPLTEANLLMMIEGSLTGAMNGAALDAAVAELKRRNGDSKYYDTWIEWAGRWSFEAAGRAFSNKGVGGPNGDKVFRGLPVVTALLRKLVLQNKLPANWLGVAWASVEEMDSAEGRRFFEAYAKFSKEVQFEIKSFENLELPKHWSTVDEFVLWNMRNWPADYYDNDFEVRKMMSRWLSYGADKIPPEALEALFDIVRNVPALKKDVDERSNPEWARSLRMQHQQDTIWALTILSRFDRVGEMKSFPQLVERFYSLSHAYVQGTGLRIIRDAPLILLDRLTVKETQGVLQRAEERAKERARIAADTAPKAPSAKTPTSIVRSCKQLFSKPMP